MRFTILIYYFRELSNLRQTEKNRTTSFSELINIFCVQGKYPKHLLDLWQIFDHEKGSENDCPDILEDDQIFIVLEFANGGEDLETFAFNNALQALSAFNQVIIWTIIFQIFCNESYFILGCSESCNRRKSFTVWTPGFAFE